MEPQNRKITKIAAPKGTGIQFAITKNRIAQVSLLLQFERADTMAK